jgi:uncharacterized repeat protein (TIGR01451 family)
VLVDAIPPGTTYVPGSAPGAEFKVGGAWQTGEPADPASVEALRWQLGTLPIGASGTQTFQVRLGTVLDNGMKIQDSASLDANGVATLHGVAAAVVESASKVTIEKDTTTTRAAKGDQVAYRVVVTTAGNAAADPLVVTDRLPRELAFVSATSGGSYANGVVTWNLGRHLPGESIELFVVTNLVAPMKTGKVTNVAAATGGSNAGGSAGGVRDAAAVVVRGASPCENGGKITLSSYRIVMGVRTAVVASVRNADGTPAARAVLALRDRTGAVKPFTATADGNGRATFRLLPMSGKSTIVVSSAGCSTSRVLHVVRSSDCTTGMSFAPGVLAVGQRRLVVVLRSGRQPVSGVPVTAAGSDTEARARTNARGVARLTVTATKAGTMTIATPAFSCSRRIGVAAAGVGTSLTG